MLTTHATRLSLELFLRTRSLFLQSAPKRQLPPSTRNQETKRGGCLTSYTASAACDDVLSVSKGGKEKRGAKLTKQRWQLEPSGYDCACCMSAPSLGFPLPDANDVLCFLAFVPLLRFAWFRFASLAWLRLALVGVAWLILPFLWTYFTLLLSISLPTWLFDYFLGNPFLGFSRSLLLRSFIDLEPFRLNYFIA